eukprot:TRINITY_DN4493_c0_g3_i1.p1 TRINITY_DN4493_c0_g3~~TRINITY_DN4493_c0_g3_i1.p1  ORF type:complete len:313 (-),score=109.23 TRINITY_DN4493_c0_g3_i1:93-1031(-)
MIIDGGYQVFVYGGFLRDLFHGKIGDDIDILFTCPVDFLVEECDKREWSYYLKRSEKTGKVRKDFIAIGTKGATGKFSGHCLGVGCQGEFTCNTLVYDVSSQTLVDPFCLGVVDSVHRTLRIPYPPEEWRNWIDEDRLYGMRVVRFFNFRSRGMQEDSFDTLAWMTRFLVSAFANEAEPLAPTLAEKQEQLKKDDSLLQSSSSTSTDEPSSVTTDGNVEDRSQLINATFSVFLPRKVFRENIETALSKEKKFRRCVIESIDSVFGDELDGKQWYLENIAQLYPFVKKASIPKLVRHISTMVENKLEEEDIKK